MPLRVDRYELREDACAPGEWRGGLGSIREFTYLCDGGGSVEGDGHRYRPWGFAGGGEGFPAKLELARQGGAIEQMPSKVPHMMVAEGDRFICTGPAGGGYGDPLARAPARVLDDVLDGLISAATARRDYGVVISEANALDAEATATERRRPDGGRGLGDDKRWVAATDLKRKKSEQACLVVQGAPVGREVGPACPAKRRRRRWLRESCVAIGRPAPRRPYRPGPRRPRYHRNHMRARCAGDRSCERHRPDQAQAGRMPGAGADLQVAEIAASISNGAQVRRAARPR